MALDSVPSELSVPRNAKLGLYYVCLPMKRDDELKGTTNRRKCAFRRNTAQLFVKFSELMNFNDQSHCPCLFTLRKRN